MYRFRTRVKEILICLAGLGFGATACLSESSRAVPPLDPLIKAIFELDLAPGMAVAVVSGDELVYEAGFGYADVKARRLVTPETLFYIASTSKSFTAFAAALLHDESRLDLDAPLSGYLPTLVMKPPLSADEITLRDLLTHTHGIQQGGPLEFRTAFTGEFTNDQLIQLLGTYDPSPNGRVFRYGNLGYNVVGLAMESALCKGWKEVLQSEVFGPLGMTKTTAYRSQADPSSLAMPYRMGPDGVTPLHYAKDDSNMHAAGGHLTTVGDLAKYLEAHLNAGRVDGKQVFASAVVAETHRQHTEQDRNYGPLHRHGWGLGWDLGSYDGDTVIHRFGGFSGFHSHLSFMPEHRIGIAMLVNGSAGSLLANAVAAAIYDRMLGKPSLDAGIEPLLERVRNQADQARERMLRDRQRRAARPQTLPHLLEVYAGTYHNADFGSMEWSLVDGRLNVAMGLAQSTMEVYDGQNNQLRVELTGGGSVVSFTFDGDRAISLTSAGRTFDRK